MEVKDGSTLYLYRTEQRGQILFFLGRGLGSLPGGQGLLGPGNHGGATEGGLGEVLPVSLLVEDGLDLVQGPPGGKDEPLVVSSGADANNLVVDQAVVSLGVPVGQVAGLGGEGLLDAPLLQQEAARVTDDGPGDIRGNHDGCFLLL